MSEPLASSDRAACIAENQARLDAEAELRAANQRLEAVTCDLNQRVRRIQQIINTANDAFVTCDTFGSITEWNATAETLFGFSREQALGKPIDHFVSPGQADRRKGQSALTVILNAVDGTQRGQMTARHRDGHTFPVELSISAMVEEDDSFVFNAFIHDVTDRLKLQNRLNQAQKLESIGQLAAGIAHEINTPTQYVRDNVEFIGECFESFRAVAALQSELLQAIEQGGASVPSSVTQKAALLKEAVEEADLEFVLQDSEPAIEQSLEGLSRVAEIVGSMKQFAHPGAQSKSMVDLNQAIQSTSIVCRGEWKYVADMELDLDDALPRVWCVPGEINQVILNLIVNAAHALSQAGHGESKKGRITLRTRQQGEQVVIEIADNGPGVPAEIRQRIFDPFFTTKDVGQGTGQGLALAHGVIVDKHNGLLSVTDTPGGGATFVVTLPIKRNDAEAASLIDSHMGGAA